MSDMDETQEQPATAPTPEPSGTTASATATRPWYRRTGALVGGGIAAGLLLVAIGGAAGVAISEANDHRHGDEIGLSADGRFDPGQGAGHRDGDHGRGGHPEWGDGDRGDHGPWGGDDGDGPGRDGSWEGPGDDDGAGQAPAMPGAPQG